VSVTTDTPVAVLKDTEYWRKLATDAGERLKIAETQGKDLRMAADEARQRMQKYKVRLEGAQERVNELQSALIEVSAQRDALQETLAKQESAVAERLAQQETVKRKVYEFRESILSGPIWEVFAEFCRDVPADEGAKS
jgi:chromosome segregation ATPase